MTDQPPESDRPPQKVAFHNVMIAVVTALVLVYGVLYFAGIV